MRLYTHIFNIAKDSISSVFDSVDGAFLESLPFGISVPIWEYLHRLKTDPPRGLSTQFYTLLGRTDLAYQRDFHEPTVSSKKNKIEQRPFDIDKARIMESVINPSNAEIKDPHVVRPSVETQVRFCRDKRIQDVKGLLAVNEPLSLQVNILPNARYVNLI